MKNHIASKESQLILAIKEEQVAVAPETTVEVHVGIVNQGVDGDYFDIFVDGVPVDWVTIDTPVVHLAPGEAKQIILTIRPPALQQNRVGRYPLDVRAVSHSNPSLTAEAHGTLTVAAYQSEGRIGVSLGSIYFSVVPGASVTVPLLLENHGLKEDVFQLGIEGKPARWISTNAVSTKLGPTESREIEFNIHVPRSAEAHAGRTPFKIVLLSRDFPDQKAEVDCILIVGAFWQYTAALEPSALKADQVGQLVIDNEGNTPDAYTLHFQNPADVLIFQKEVQVARKESSSGAQEVETAYVEIPPDERIQVEPGERAIYAFRSRLKSRPIVGDEKTYPFVASVKSAENISREIPGEVSERGLIPPWLAVSLVVGALILSLLALIPVANARQAASATQTAAFGLTQLALPGAAQADPDGDGLLNSDEINLGTDPFRADSDDDGLPDGQEVQSTQTNPLAVDTDNDGLTDGDEVLQHMTNPINFDSDGDSLGDDVEVSLGTDPTQPDTDRDGLMDGQENQTCPGALNPDSDRDGILDGSDPGPCDPANPSLTATSIAAAPTPTAQATVIVPTNPAPTTTLPPLPSATSAIPLSPTSAVPPTSTTALPALQGLMLFASGRDGNSEIYSLNLADTSTVRLTNNAAVDQQPALAPDLQRVLYVSNQNGNNEIYLTGLDRRPPVNLTNNPGDDSQPAWSPDGNWIAFTSNRDGNPEVYVMRSDGSQVRNVTASAVGGDFDPAWFSVTHLLGLVTEDWIVFTTTRDGNQEVYKVRPNGTGLTNLTRNPGNDHSPSSFAGGGLLAFVTDRDGNPEIYTMTSDGTSPVNRTANPAQDLDPVLDPSGGWIAFTSDRDGNLEIYVVNLTDGSIYNLTRNTAQDQFPDW